MIGFRRGSRGVKQVAIRWLLLAWAPVGLATEPATTSMPSGLEVGEYIFKIASCSACHTREDGPALSGGRALPTPFGTFYSPNITPHLSQGIGHWSQADFVRALRQGIAPDGGHYYPAFPYPSYTGMSDPDLAALFGYLQSVPAIEQSNQDHDLNWIFGFRILNWFWKLLFFERGPFVADPARSASLNRGAYLVEALAHCGECHTPRGWFGAVKRSQSLGGNPDGPEGSYVPNITPHPESGIGAWSPSEIVDYLTAGELPDGDYAGGAMAEVIDEGLQYLKPDDARAIAEYLRALPPVVSKDE